MKKSVLYIIMLVTTCATVYFTMVWEPINEEQISFEKENKSVVQVVNDNNGIIDEEINLLVKEDIAKPTMASVSLLKMDINEIEENMSVSDKTTLIKIGYKLQNIDKKKIEDWVINSNNQIDGVRNAYNLLKSRLSTNDFKELEDIMGTYINLELLK